MFLICCIGLLCQCILYMYCVATSWILCCVFSKHCTWDYQISRYVPSDIIRHSQTPRCITYCFFSTAQSIEHRLYADVLYMKLRITDVYTFHTCARWMFLATPPPKTIQPMASCSLLMHFLNIHETTTECHWLKMPAESPDKSIACKSSINPSQ
jgi:hypothetical protein